MLVGRKNSSHSFSYGIERSFFLEYLKKSLVGSFRSEFANRSRVVRFVTHAAGMQAYKVTGR